MGYAKQWTPPTIPLRDDLAAWKTLFTDVHDCLIDAGLVQTATAGQLDISAVSALPADGTFEGFREYRFDDALQSTAPVIVKLEFGCGAEGLSSGGGSSSRSRTPRIRATVAFKGTNVVGFQCPQAYNASATATSQLTTPGASYICYSEADGFFGLCYGAGSRNKPFTISYGNYYGATLTLFIQRTLDSSGTPTGDGLGVYGPNLSTYDDSNIWGAGKLSRSLAAFSSGGSPVAKDSICPRIGRSDIAAGVDGLLLEPLHYPSAPPQPFPFMVSYYHTTITEGRQFQFQPVVGPARNFIALGRETCLAVDSEEAHYAGVAMLFE